MHKDFVFYKVYDYIKVMGISTFLKALATKVFCREATILYQLRLSEYNMKIEIEVPVVIEDVNNRKVEDKINSCLELGVIM